MPEFLMVLPTVILFVNYWHSSILQNIHKILKQHIVNSHYLCHNISEGTTTRVKALPWS